MLEHIGSSEAIKIGFLPTHRGVFDAEPAIENREKIEDYLDNLDIDYVNLEGITEHGLLDDPEDAPAVVKRFQEEDIDAIFVAHCSFGEETAVGEVCKELDLPVLLWGIRDESPAEDGTRHGDVQCGLFAMGKVLRRLDVSFTYLVNTEVESPVFRQGMDTFLRAVKATNSVLGARIGQVSTRPTPFASVACNEGELLERFGIHIIPTALSNITSDAMGRLEEPDVEKEMESVRERVDVQIEEEELQKIVALKLALIDWAEEQRLDAIALQCWRALQQEMDICPCFVHGELTDLGLPVACETDVHGAITSLAVQAAAGFASPVFFADLTVRHPENDNGELLWHCGPFPLSLAAEDASPALTPHFGMEKAGAGEWRIRGGDITLARFDGDHGDYKLLMGHARGTDGPETVGTYLWAEMIDWPLWEEKVVRGPYVHHVVGIHGKIAPALWEACKYIGIEPDPVEPNESEIRHFMRQGAWPPTEGFPGEPSDELDITEPEMPPEVAPDEVPEEAEEASETKTAEEEAEEKPTPETEETPEPEEHEEEPAEQQEPERKEGEEAEEPAPEPDEETPTAENKTEEEAEEEEKSAQTEDEPTAEETYSGIAHVQENVENTDWHITSNGEQYGPYSTNRMWDMIDEGRITQDTMIWNESMGQWHKASDVLPFASVWDED